MTVQELYEAVGGSYESAKRVLPSDALIGKFILKFLNDASFGKLEAAWAARDAAGMFEGAHALKGVCANLGLNALSAAASELAEEFRPGSARALEDAEVERRMDALREAYARTLDGIRAFAGAQ